MKLSDLKGNNPPMVLIYGAAGAGKTALVTQAKDCFVFDFDNGLRTCITLKDKFYERRQQIEFEQYIDEVNESMQLVDPKYPKFRKKLLEVIKDDKYKTIVIDSLTGLTRSITLFVMSTTGNPFAVPKIQHYGMMINELETILTILRSSKKLVLITAHEMLVETDEEALIRIMSITKPHGMNRLPFQFDEVLYATTRRRAGNKIDYIVSGRATRALVARTRTSFREDFVHNEEGLDGLLKKINYEM